MAEILKGFKDLNIDPFTAPISIPTVITLGKRIGVRLSSSQAAEALFLSKGSIDRMNEPMSKEDFERFVNWFDENKQNLKTTSNYFLVHANMKKVKSLTHL